VTISDDVEKMFAEIKTKFGRLDVLLNNAGMAENIGRLHEIPIKNVQSIFSVNQLGAWHVLK